MLSVEKFGVILFLVVFVSTFRNILAQSICRNPNQSYGYCISIYDCQTLLGVVSRSSVSEVDKRFIRSSECANGFGTRPYVCCTRDTGFSRKNRFGNNAQRETQHPSFAFPSEKKSTRELDIPRPPNCGGITFQNKIYGGEDTDLKEFSWVVLLEYKKKNGGISMNCAGSLINRRYILTAAHCVKGEIETKIGKLLSVRVGEYDISTTTDCKNNECLSPATRYGVEEIIPHDNYDDKSTDRHNDIALVRLSRDVEYTDSVQPVCLPFVVESRSLPVGTNLTVSGWGRTLTAQKSTIKQKVTVPHFDLNECQRKFRSRRVNIDSTQICAGGNFAEDSCDGDSGGPLMLLQGSNWVIEGVVSFGVKCGFNGWPAVHTRVSSYENWIKSKLR